MKKIALFLAVVAVGAVVYAQVGGEDPVRACNREGCWSVTVNRGELTAFNKAVLANDADTVARLIEAGIPVGLESLGIGPPLEYISPMIIAVQSNHFEVIRLFLDRGGNADTRYSDGATLLILAAYHGYIGLANLLLEHKADVNARDDLGAAPLLYASQEGHLETVTLLLEQGADVKVQDNKGESALMLAALKKQDGAIDILLAQPNIDVNQKNARGKTALDYAKGRRVKELLKEAGAKRGKEL